jgi:hypothetical protein
MELKPAKPTLRELAQKLRVSVETDAGIVKTTHQLGSHVIKAIKADASPTDHVLGHSY